ncbi:MAG: hypothetical protein LUD16_11960 [Lachnospiraceae bacterium]|nr:hypothetical protein [Lachnospiraceae bacterium]
MSNDKKITLAFLCGLLGCLCFGVGDWLMPDSAFRLAFMNGLMSESMVLWFGSILIWSYLHRNSK